MFGKWKSLSPLHCMKSVQIRGFFWSVFSYIRNEYGNLRSKSPYSVRIQENRDRINSVFGYFSRSVTDSKGKIILQILGEQIEMLSEVSKNNGFKCKCQRLYVTNIRNNECWCKVFSELCHNGIETCSSEEMQHASDGSFQQSHFYYNTLLKFTMA